MSGNRPTQAMRGGSGSKAAKLVQQAAVTTSRLVAWQGDGGVATQLYLAPSNPIVSLPAFHDSICLVCVAAMVEEASYDFNVGTVGRLEHWGGYFSARSSDNPRPCFVPIVGSAAEAGDASVGPWMVPVGVLMPRQGIHPISFPFLYL